MCPGDQLNLTCHTTPNETLLQWSIDIPSRPAPEQKFFSSGSNTVSVTPLTVGQTVFQFIRTSTSPLTSLMVIDNVSSDVNGTRVECSYLGGRVVSTDIIKVIGNGEYLLPLQPLARVFNLPLSELHVFNFMFRTFSLYQNLHLQSFPL